jgi:hypothetical protein
MRYKLIAIDLDGTLLDKRENISELNKTVLKKVRSKGVKLAIVTGRRYHSMLKIANQLEVDSPYVCFNGGLIVDYEKNEIIKNVTLDKDFATEAFDIIADSDIPIFSYKGTLDKTNVYFKNESNHPRVKMYLEQEGEQLFRVDNGNQVGFLPMCIKTFGYEEEVDKAYSLVKDIVPKNVQVLRTVGVNGTHYLEFFPKKANKVFGLEYLSQFYNIPQNDIIAIGDNLNDKEMIQWAGLGVAVGNAHPDIKKVACMITENAEDSGVGKALIEIFNL